MPLAGQIKAEFVFATGRRRTLTVNGKNRAENFQQLLRRPSVQILQHPVVGQNLHLIVRKNHGEEPAAFTRALAILINARRRRAAMMAVGDVQVGNPRKLRFDEFEFVRLPNRPGHMPHAVPGREINLRLAGGLFRDEFVQGTGGRIGQEHRAGLRVQRLDVPHAVVLLVHARQLVFPDDAALVFLATGGGDEAGLRYGNP